MRKIYQGAPDVDQRTANRAIAILEEHVVAAGVRRFEELNDEQKVCLFKVLKKFFEDEAVYDYQPEQSFWQQILRLGRVFRRLVTS